MYFAFQLVYEQNCLFLIMVIERNKDEILIRVSSNTDLTGLQRILDFVRFREITSISKATEAEIEALAKESKADWWSKNKDRFVK